MARLGGLLFIVIALWVAVTVYNEGSERAFGGLFGAKDSGQEAELEDGEYAPAHERAGKRWLGAHQSGIDRAERVFDED